MDERKIDDLLKIVQENADKEFDGFKEAELQKGKEEIFNDNYQIRFFDEIHEFLISESLLDSEELETIASEGTSFISLLYDFYLDREYASINSWDDIVDLIADYCGCT